MPPAGRQLFGVVVTANTVNPANFDLAVVYNPPGGAAGIQKQVVVEQFTDLSLNTSGPQLRGNCDQLRVAADPCSRELRSSGHAARRLSGDSHDAL